MNSPSELRRHWPVIAACFLVAIHAWTYGFYGLSAYVAAFQREQGWSNAMTSGATSAFYLVGAVALARAPLWVQRFGPRTILLGGCAALSLGATIAANATAPWHLVLGFLILALGWACTSVPALSTVIALWFDARRGMAMSLALNGASAAGFTLAPALVWLSDRHGIAWAGTLLGYTYIHEGTHDARIRKMAFDYVTDDVIPVLNTPEHPSPIDLAAYRDVVLDRFGNPAIADTNQRVAMDGFSKIPGFIAPTLRERLARGESIASVAMLPALFLAYLQRWHAGQVPYTYQDQAMDPASAHAMCQAPDPVAAFAADTVLWGDLASDARLLAALRLASKRVDNFVQGHTA